MLTFYGIFQVMLYVDMEVNGVPLKVSDLSQLIIFFSTFCSNYTEYNMLSFSLLISIFNGYMKWNMH